MQCNGGSRLCGYDYYNEKSGMRGRETDKKRNGCWVKGVESGGTDHDAKP